MPNIFIQWVVIIHKYVDLFFLIKTSQRFPLGPLVPSSEKWKQITTKTRPYFHLAQLSVKSKNVNHCNALPMRLKPFRWLKSSLSIQMLCISYIELGLFTLELTIEAALLPEWKRQKHVPWRFGGNIKYSVHLSCSRLLIYNINEDPSVSIGN
jgi:hypothetical protein